MVSTQHWFFLYIDTQNVEGFHHSVYETYSIFVAQNRVIPKNVMKINKVVTKLSKYLISPND